MLGSEQDLWWMLGRAAAGSAFHASCRLITLGRDRIPASGGALLVYNHVSVLDAIAISLSASRPGRVVYSLSVPDVFDRPLLGPALRRLRQIPVTRGWETIERVAGVIREGRLAAVAPEGHVGAGEPLQPFQKGAARIALMAGQPVVPLGIWGTQARWPKDGPRWSTPTRPRVVVAWGEPLEAVGDPRSRADTQVLTDRLREAVLAMVPAARAAAEGPRLE